MTPIARHGCVALAACTLLLFAGCSPWATYPPVEVAPAQAMTKETFEPLPTVMALSIDYVRETYLPGQDLAVNLPAGSGWQSYEKVFEKTKADDRPLMQSSEKAVHIKEVRTRAFDAECDVIYPRADGLNQLVTLKLQREVFKDWRVKSARLWQIRDIAAPDPSYVAPTPEELAKKKREQGPAGEIPASQPEK